MPIFNSDAYYRRFIKAMVYYQVAGPKPRFSRFEPMIHKIEWINKMVDIICFCLMPNHFHFLVKQTRECGVKEFIGNLSNSFTRYFNTKENRIGPILQGEFKAVLIENNAQLIHVSRYIHLNPLVSDITSELENYEWSSYPEYIGMGTNNTICSKDIILDQFKDSEEYRKFVLDQEAYGRELEFIKHQLIDI